MSRTIGRIILGLFTLFVIGGLAFGASQVLATSPGSGDCGQQSAGTCPPLNEATCDDACHEMFGSPDGACHIPTGCCICVV